MSEQINDGGPAFPMQVHASPSSEVHFGLTVRQYAAIKLCVPDSGTPWLDEMIQKSLRDKLAGQALAGLLCSPNTIKVNGTPIGNPIQYTDVAYDLADEMLERRKK